MNKVIKSAVEGSSYRLKVERGFSEESIFVSVQGGRSQESIAIADKDIPRLMLALGEAAGVVPKWNSWSEGGTPEHLAHILGHLQKYIEAQEAIAAQAEETAKLEAEALELRNAFSMAIGGASIDSFVGHSLNKPGWIDAARRAREIAKEATK